MNILLRVSKLKALKKAEQQGTASAYRRLAKGRSWKERRGVSLVLFSALARLT